MSHPDAHQHGGAHGHAVAGGHSFSHRDGSAQRKSHTDRNGDAHAHADADKHANANTNTNTDKHANANTNTNADKHANANTNTNSDADPDEHADTVADPGSRSAASRRSSLCNGHAHAHGGQVRLRRWFTGYHDNDDHNDGRDPSENGSAHHWHRSFAHHCTRNRCCGDGFRALERGCVLPVQDRKTLRV